MSKRERYLYEDAIDKDNWVEIGTGMPVMFPTYAAIRDAEKIVLDDHAASMALNLSHSMPIDIYHMLDCALPPSQKVWIEWRSGPQNREKAHRAMFSGQPYEHFAVDRPSFSGCGVLIESYDIGYRVRCIEHWDETHKVMEWPLAFDVSNSTMHDMYPGWLRSEDERSEELVIDEKLKGKKKLIEQTALFWGYQPDTKGLYNLNHKACGAVALHMTRLYGADAKVVNMTASELTGLVRQTVATLAMLRTTMEVETVPREKGRYLSSGKTHPYYDRKIARLNIPGRVRKVEDYVRKQIRDEANRVRHRLHKVKAHFRHRREKPAADGWVRCYCPGRSPGKWWHKRIEDHWRGDEELGIVTHDHTLVTGPASLDQSSTGIIRDVTDIDPNQLQDEREHNGQEPQDT